MTIVVDGETRIGNLRYRKNRRRSQLLRLTRFDDTLLD